MFFQKVCFKLEQAFLHNNKIPLQKILRKRTAKKTNAALFVFVVIVSNRQKKCSFF